MNHGCSSYCIHQGLFLAMPAEQWHQLRRWVRRLLCSGLHGSSAGCDCGRSGWVRCQSTAVHYWFYSLVNRFVKSVVLLLRSWSSLHRLPSGYCHDASASILDRLLLPHARPSGCGHACNQTCGSCCLYIKCKIYKYLFFQFVTVESFVTTAVDMFPRWFRAPVRREIFVLVVCVLCFLVHLVFVTEVSSEVHSNEHFLCRTQTWRSICRMTPEEDLLINLPVCREEFTFSIWPTFTAPPEPVRTSLPSVNVWPLAGSLVGFLLSRGLQ